MLGETFEDSRMKFIAEKVRHNPLEIAYHAEGNHWELTSTSCAVLSHPRQKSVNNTAGSNAVENWNR